MFRSIFNALLEHDQRQRRKRRHRQYRGNNTRRLAIEPLETRALLAALTWDGGGTNSNFNNPENWDPDNVPDAADDLTFETDAGTITVSAAQETGSISLAGDASVTLVLGPKLETNGNALTLGGAPSLTLTGMGLFDTEGGEVDVGSGGELSVVNGAELRAGVLSANGLFEVDHLLDTGAATVGEIGPGSINTGGGTINSGGTWNIAGTLTVNSSLRVDGGEVAVTGAATFNSGLATDLTDGTLVIRNGGVVRLSGGGTSNNDAIINVNGATLDLGEHELTNNGTITTGLGGVLGTPTAGKFALDGDLEQTDVGTTVVNIGGTQAVDKFDKHSVFVIDDIDDDGHGGDAMLDGTLDVSFIDDFGDDIAVGDVFDVIEADSISGQFDNLPAGVYMNFSEPVTAGTLPALDGQRLPGAAWKVSYGDVDEDGKDEVRLQVVDHLFEMHGRFGDNNGSAGDWEIGLTTNTNAPPQHQENVAWEDGEAAPFTFEITDDFVASFTVNGKTIMQDYSGEVTDTIDDLFLWARAVTPESGLQLTDLMLDGEALADVTVDHDAGNIFAQLSEPVDVSDGLTLSGNVTMDWGATEPLHSKLQFHLVAYAEGAAEEAAASQSQSLLVSPAAADLDVYEISANGENVGRLDTAAGQSLSYFGDANDRMTLIGPWQRAGTTTVAGETYNVFTENLGQIRIRDEVRVLLVGRGVFGLDLDDPLRQVGGTLTADFSGTEMISRDKGFADRSHLARESSDAYALQASPALMKQSDTHDDMGEWTSAESEDAESLAFADAVDIVLQEEGLALL